MNVVTDLQQQAARISAIARQMHREGASMESANLISWARVYQSIAADWYAEARQALAGFSPGKPLGGAGVSRSDKPPASDPDALTDPQP